MVKTKRLNIRNRTYYFHDDLIKTNPTDVHVNGNKKLNIKNRTYYFYSDLINLDGFDADLLKLDKQGVMNINVYYIGYVTKNLPIMLIVLILYI